MAVLVIPDSSTRIFRSPGERHVEELAAEIGQSVANTSFHLRTLAAAGLVATRRDGTRIYYWLASDRVVELWTAMRDVAARHLDHLEALASAYLGDRSRLEQIDRAELAARIAAGDVIVIDVRPAPEFAAGHITGARSVPVDLLAEHLRSIPADVEVVAYCRGPYCVMADDAVRLLRRRGRRARRLEDGFPEWRRAGLPVEAGLGGVRPAVAATTQDEARGVERRPLRPAPQEPPASAALTGRPKRR